MSTKLLAMEAFPNLELTADIVLNYASSF